MNKQFLLKRKRIIEELFHIKDYPLTLLVAPMGYGKTTVAIEALQEMNIDYLWFFFEIEEESPKYIWDTFARQLKQTHPELGRLFQNLGFPFTTPQRNELFTLLASFASDHPVYLVFDDFQFNQSKEIDHLLRMLVCADIKGLHILVLSRSIPDFGVTELELKGKCYHIPERYFAISLQEVAKLYRIYRVPVDEGIIEKTYLLSEGWISAILLIIKRYKETMSIDAVDHIDELITQAVMPKFFDQLPLLAILGIIDSFSVDQLRQIIGKEEADHLLETLIHSGAFIRYDMKSKRYMVHNIFQRYIKEYIFDTLTIDLQKRYYQSSGKWFIDHEFIMEGIRCYRAANEYERILLEFEKDTIMKIFDYYPEVVSELLSEIPISLKHEHPVAYLCYLHFLITAHNPLLGAKLLTDFKTQQGIMKIPTAVDIEGELAFLEGLMSYNHVGIMMDHFKRAYALMGSKSVTTRPDKMPCSGSYSILFLYYRTVGAFKETAEIIHRDMEVYEHLSARVGTGINEITLGEYYYEIGDIAQAMTYAKRGLYKSKILPQYDAYICASFLLARCELAVGRINEAAEIIENLTKEESFEVTTLFYSIRSPYLYALDAIKLLTCQGDQVSDSLKHRELDSKMLFFQSKGLGYILHAQYLLSQEKYIEAEMFADTMTPLFQPFNQLLGFMHRDIIMAIASYHLYGEEKAKLFFDRVIEVARIDGIIMTIAEYGDQVIPLLKLYDDEDDYLLSIKERASIIAIARQCKKVETSIKLTPREEDIMKLLKQGYSNAEISQTLFISVSAVKKMLTAIYRKFGVKNRTSAIKYYEQL